jgi:hypothetical protein
MAITAQDLIRFGLIQDPKAYLDTETKKARDAYESDIAKQYQVIRSATTDREYDRAYDQLNRLVEQRERKFTQIDQQYTRLLARQDQALESPGIIGAARQRIESEIGKQREELQARSREDQEKFRVESEGIERGQAEREAGRIRSRRAGAGGRGMLAGYGLSVPQGIGGKSTLGLAGPVGSPTGGGRASTLGRSLLG